MTCLPNIWACLIEPLQFQFFLRALLAATMIGGICAVIGAFVVLRDLAFIGDAVAHSAFPGVVLAFLLQVNLVVGGAVFGLLTAIGVGFVTRRSRVSADTAIGVLFAGAFALGVVLISSVKTYTKDLFGLLLGDVLAISSVDLVVIAGLGLIVLTVVILLYKELVLLTFDPVTAEVEGLPVDRLQYLLLTLLAVTIVIAIQTVGIVLVVAMLVTPAASAYLWTRRFPTMMALGAVLGVLAAIVGLYLSFYLNVASGATIVLVSTGLFALALLVSPRGLGLGRRLRSRWRGGAE